jgi:hypothetical protein
MRQLEVLLVLFFLTKFKYLKINTMKKLLLILLFVPLVSFGQSQKKNQKNC